MTDIYQLGCKVGLLNYIDHETPRVYFIHAHADLEEFEAFCKALTKERDAEIERLREALQSIEKICAEDGMPHEIRSFRAMREAKAALKEETDV